MKTETGWLIEDGSNFPQYLTAENGLFAWTFLNDKAIRFSRREDAEMVAAVIDEDAWAIVEHMWHLD